MTEQDFLSQQIAVMQRRLSLLQQPQREYVLRSAPTPAYDHLIEFDGGTSCNIPSKGFGNGYGSFQINSSPIQRVEFGYGHSCNSAEIRTLCRALAALASSIDKPKDATVLVRGDSQIALKWVTCKKHPTKKGTEKFKEAITMLRIEVAKFKCIRTEWRGREHSVKLFGH